jgi:DNA polymerase III alpha subunit
MEMIELTNRQIDDHGNVIFQVEDLYPLLMKGYDIRDYYVWDSPALQKFRQTCRTLDNDDLALRVYEVPEIDPIDKFIACRNNWLIPETYKQLDIRSKLLGKCETDTQRERVLMELSVFERYELMDMLGSLVYLVETFDANQVVRGVGRGSSVSSYVLYLIGVHRVDSLLYDLDFDEFLN